MSKKLQAKKVAVAKGAVIEEPTRETEAGIFKKFTDLVSAAGPDGLCDWEHWLQMNSTYGKMTQNKIVTIDDDE